MRCTTKSILRASGSVSSLRDRAFSGFEALETRQMLAADFQIEVGLLDPTGPVQPSATINVPIFLNNAGDEFPSGDVTLRLFTSTDATFDSSDTEVFARTLNTGEIPAPGQALSSTRTFDVPATLANGTYFVIGTVVHSVLGGPILGEDSAPSLNTFELGVAPAPDLQITAGAVDPATAIVGSTLNLPVSITNAGTGAATAPVTLNLFASADGVLDPTDISLFSGPVTDVEVPGPGATLDRTVSFTVPQMTAGTYFVIASVVTQTVGGPIIAQDDSVSTNSFQLSDVTVLNFSVGSPVSFTDADGTKITVSLEGRGASGTGQVMNFGNGIVDVTVAGSNERTALVFRSGGGDRVASLRNITVDGSLKKIDAKVMNLAGAVSITGTLSEARLNDVGGDSTFTIGGDSKDVRLSFNNVENLSITSAAPIAELRARAWADTNATLDLVTAPSIKRIFTQDDFGASLALSGLNTRKRTLENVDIKGQITGGSWVIEGDVGDIASRGILDAWSASINGDVKSLRVHGDTAGTLVADSINKIDLKGAVNSALVLAGANLGADGIMGGDGANADTFGGGTIKSIMIRGPVTSSTFGAGIDPVDGILFNGNDAYAQTSRIGRVSVRGTVTESSFLARNLTGDINTPSGGDNDGGNGNNGGNGNGGNNGNNGGGNDRDDDRGSKQRGFGLLAHLLRHLQR